MTSVAHARGRSAGDRMLRTAARGAILIGIAVIIGIVLLQVVDDAGSPQASNNAAGRTTTTTDPGGLAPQSITVIVFNASGLSGAAGTQTNELRGLGYLVLEPGNAASQQIGSTVACQAGFEKEAEALVAIVDGAALAAFPAPVPAGAETANCIIVVGS
ncbi:MAG: LytR family transcriptional regulator [Actinobacteria bacterium]|nr:LytR family transcriptional regulator [Actinomycetota bacterium]